MTANVEHKEAAPAGADAPIVPETSVAVAAPPAEAPVKPAAKPRKSAPRKVSKPASDTARSKAEAATIRNPLGKPARDKTEKPAKPKKVKLIRDSYAMPEIEYARFGDLKKRLLGLGVEAKKSELLRAGMALLASLDDQALQEAVARVERIKTGRPARKG